MLADHVVEHGGNVINRNGLESHSQNSVELGNQEGDSGLVNGFGKNLVLNSQTSNGDIILAQKSSQGTTSVF